MSKRAEQLNPSTLGYIALFGSGETSYSGGRIFEEIARRLPDSPQVAVLETPAGFEPNSAQVAGRIADFVRVRLQNYHPELSVLPARKLETAFSPDDPAITDALLRANLIFLGPGSPTYAVRQLAHSLAWHRLLARHRLGAAVAFASAAAIAASVQALPVYEIYKAGADLYWSAGLDFFGAYGLSLVLIPHWNNTDGGAELDTSCCYMGRARFEELRTLLLPGITVVGIDENTGLIIDLQAATCEVIGHGGVVILKDADERRFDQNSVFSLYELGPFRHANPQEGIPPAVWAEAHSASLSSRAPPTAPTEVLAYVEQREQFRRRRNWAAADELRDRIAALGWQVSDTPSGPVLEPIKRS